MRNDWSGSQLGNKLPSTFGLFLMAGNDVFVVAAIIFTKKWKERGFLGSIIIFLWSISMDFLAKRFKGLTAKWFDCETAVSRLILKGNPLTWRSI